MAFQYERDDASRRVVITVQGAFPQSELLSIIERQRAEDTWSYGILYDLRHMTGEPSLYDLREAMGEATSRRPTDRPRGPVALLTSDPVLYGVACKYAALGHSKLRVEVFRDLDQADRWLSAETRPSS